MATAGLRRAVLQRENTAFLCCDIQERFRDVCFAFPSLIHTARKLCLGGEYLGVPVYATEQYPKGLGATVSELPRNYFARVVEKTSFSMIIPELLEHFQPKHKSFVLFGIEAHVCVYQTAISLLSNPENSVHLVADGISASSPGQIPIALRSLEQYGAEVTTSDCVLFRLLGGSQAPGFKEISNLVKESLKVERNELLNLASGVSKIIPTLDETQSAGHLCSGFGLT